MGNGPQLSIELHVHAGAIVCMCMQVAGFQDLDRCWRQTSRGDLMPSLVKVYFRVSLFSLGLKASRKLQVSKLNVARKSNFRTNSANNQRFRILRSNFKQFEIMGVKKRCLLGIQTPINIIINYGLYSGVMVLQDMFLFYNFFNFFCKEIV